MDKISIKSAHLAIVMVNCYQNFVFFPRTSFDLVDKKNWQNYAGSFSKLFAGYSFYNAVKKWHALIFLDNTWMIL